MRETPYFSTRTGKVTGTVKIDLPQLRRMFHALYVEYEGRHYFQHLLGYNCCDNGHTAGLVGNDVEMYLLRKLKKENIWPPEARKDDYSEDDLFDLIELFYDGVAKPTDGWFHQWNNCGWHSTKYDPAAGREEFRASVNEILRDYGPGYELSAQGEVLQRVQPAMEELVTQPIESVDTDNVVRRVETAIHKFRTRHATAGDKRDAVRDLADVFEFQRAKVKDLLITEDERDLFNLANNFGIRHHNEQQKTKYDEDIWLDWAFYYYLNTLHAFQRILKRSN